MPRTWNPGQEYILKRHGKHTRESTHTPSQPQLTADEIEQLRRPEIPLDLWRNGEALLSSKLERLTIQRVGRQITNNPATKKIKADKAELRKLIVSTPQLVEDFEFFTKKLGWSPEGLLQHLYWDCNMMHATPQTVIAKQKRKHWPMDRAVLDALCDDISTLAARLEKLNRTKFSPARAVILHAETGGRLPPVRERYLLKAFRELPEILRFYGGDLKRKVLTNALYWSKTEKSWEFLVKGARQDSVYERIRAKAGKYHAVRLHRLVKAARQIQNLSPIEWYAFRKWLGELKQRHEKGRLQPAR
jgi:hypothetical protein